MSAPPAYAPQAAAVQREYSTSVTSTAPRWLSGRRSATRSCVPAEPVQLPATDCLWLAVRAAHAVPPGWEQQVDQSSGRPYYVDHNTGTTHWEPPAPPPAYAGAPPAYAAPGAAPAASPAAVPAAAVEGVPGQGVVYAQPAQAAAPAGYGQPMGGGVAAAYGGGMQQAQGAYLQAQPVQAQQQQPQAQRAPLRSGAPIEEKRAAAQQAFQMYDTDRSGTIDMNEFASALGYLGLQISREDAGAIFCIIDSDGNGTLSMTEFIEHYVANY
jgi:hypothetical protein